MLGVRGDRGRALLMIAMNAEERDWQRTDKLFLVLIAPSAIKVDPGITENNHDVRGLGFHTCAEMSNALKVAVSIASQINHRVPPVYIMGIS